MSDSTITSNATNFSDPIQTGVDPRTGIYSMSIHLGDFLSYKGSGLGITLSLSHNPSSNRDEGFGRGWTLPMSQYDKDKDVLALSTGQSFQLEWSDGSDEATIPYRKLKDIRVFWISQTDEIQV
ncbi:hypothetical protein C1141_21265, partial [Vibrio agarivorans]